MGTSIDYTSRDFDTIVAALKTHVATKFPTTWRDMTESQTGMVWLELCAYVFDVLSFYLDYTANENYLPTARDRASVLNIGKMVGYQMRPPTSASVRVKATIASAQAVDVVIPEGTVVSSSSGVSFSTLEAQSITAGLTEALITFVEGLVRSATFTSDGTSFQKMQLPLASVISESLTVLVDGDEWSYSDSLVYGDGDSQIYAIEYDDDDIATIQFGDGTNGKAPPLGAIVEVTYRTGGGTSGNIAVGQISETIQGELLGVSPTTYVDVVLYNEERGSGGEPQETIAHAKFWIPRWIKTNGRAVTKEDFETLANTFVDPIYGTVAYAKAMLRFEIPEYNTVDIYVWGRDESGAITTCSQGLKDAIEAYFNNNGTGAIRIICTDCEVQDGENIFVDVSVGVKRSTEYGATEIINAVTAAITDLFPGTTGGSSISVSPGDDFRIARVYSSVQDVRGVDYSVVRRLTASRRYSEIVGTGNGSTKTFAGVLNLSTGLEVVPFSCSITHGNPAEETITDDGAGRLVNGSSEAVGTIDYVTGIFSFEFANAPASLSQVVFVYREVISYQRGDLESTADGSIARFNGRVSHCPVLPLSGGENGIAFSDGFQVVVDDGNGNLVGSVDPLGRNVFDYETGAYDFTFLLTPSAGAEIRSTYRQLLRTASDDIPILDSQLAVKGVISVSML